MVDQRPDSQLLSEHYRQLNAELHARVPTYGTTGRRYVETIRRLARRHFVRTILDYGCGKRDLSTGVSAEFEVRDFDPALPGLDTPPDPAELVACIDVLEHVEPAFLENVLADLVRVTTRIGFFTIATRPSGKQLADGNNAHRIVEGVTWWLQRLENHFDVNQVEIPADGNGLQVDQEFGEANVLAVPQETSVLALDCARLTWNIRELVDDLDAGRLSYDSLMTCRAVAQVGYNLPRRWNWLDNSPTPMPAGLALLHYTVTSTQPWVSSGHPLGHLWLGALFDAIEDGSINRTDVEQAVSRGFVRPSLLYQLDHHVTTKTEIPADTLRADEPFAEYCRSVKYVITDGRQR